MHCHSIKSDGDSSPEVVFNYYKKAGYDFICLTDHDVYAGQDAVPNPGSSTLFYLPGVEESQSIHINRIGSAVGLDSTDPQDTIDDIVSKGGVACINHPTLTGLSSAYLLALTGYSLIEIRSALVEYYCHIDPSLDEVLWDELLAAGRVVWGVAVDDMHVVERDLGFTAVMVFADTPDEILNSLKNGNFYAMESNGAIITRLNLIGNHLFIEVSDPSDFEFIGAAGILQQNIGVKKASYTISGSEGYVRVRIKNAASGDYTWTQPIFTDLRAIIPAKSLSECGRLFVHAVDEIGSAVP